MTSGNRRLTDTVYASCRFSENLGPAQVGTRNAGRVCESVSEFVGAARKVDRVPRAAHAGRPRLPLTLSLSLTLAGLCWEFPERL